MREPGGVASDPPSPQAVMELVSAFMQSRALLTACELDLFTVLGGGERSAEDVARALDVDGRAADRLMNVLVTLGLLEKRAGRFRNAPAASRFLVRGAPDFVGGLGHWADLWESWSTLTPAVRKGGTVFARPAGERGKAWLEAFIAAMHWRATQHAPSVVAGLDLTGVSRVLDVGGGSGAYAVAFVRARREITALVFDLPSVLPLTRAYVEQGGLSDRVRVVAGDYDQDPLPVGFDLVLLSAVIHSNSREANRALIRKCAAALNPSGQLVVQDFIVDEERTGPPFAVLFALNMLVGTPAGDTYTESEVRSWMEGAGLRSLRRQDMPFGTSLIVGRSA